MKVSLKWLSDYVEVPSDIKAFCDKLDLTGTGVEGVDKLGAAFDGVVVGYVETCEDHPDSDHMHVVKVNVGGDEPIQIVCGAPNIAAGIKVPVATIGAVLPGDFKIKKSKLRGVTSMGMCCSKRELGMGTDHEGIWVLPEDAQIGRAYRRFHGTCRYGARPGNHPEPTRQPFRCGLCPRGWRYVRQAVDEPASGHGRQAGA